MTEYYQQSFQYQIFTEPIINDAPNKVASFWYQPWENPVREKIAKGLAIALIASGLTQTLLPATDVTGIKYLPLSEPVRVAPRDAWFQPFTIGPAASDVTGIQYLPLSEPVRTAPRDCWFQPFTWVQPNQPATDATAIPYLALSEPVRVPPRTAWFQPLVQALTDQTDVTGIKYPWWSEPVRSLPRTVWYQPDTWGNAGPFPEEVSEDRWHQPWSEPVRQKPGLSAAAQQSFAANIFPISNFQVDVDMWFRHLSEPVRVPPRTVWFQPDTISLNPVVTFTYYNWLTEPVRQPPRASFFNWLSYTESAPFPEEVSEDRWHQPWSEPVRLPPRLATALNPAYHAPDPRPLPQILVSQWFAPLTDPVRVWPRAVWFEDVVLTRIASDVLGLQYLPLSEPVRIKPNVVWQQFTTPPRPFIPLEPAGFRGWYGWLNEPVRLPVGLKTYLQSTTVIPPRIIVITTTGTMAAFERGDSFLAGLSSFNRVFSGEVGVIDVPPVSGEVGIIEVTQVSGSVGNVVNVTANESGTPVSSGISARVSIRTS